MERRELALRMREVVDHLGRASDHWQFCDGAMETFTLQSMERDLAELQRLCRAARQTATAGYHCSRAA